MTSACVYSVVIDVPDAIVPSSMEGAIAQAVASYFANAGLPGNCIVSLVRGGAPGSTVAALPVTPKIDMTAAIAQALGIATVAIAPSGLI